MIIVSKDGRGIINIQNVTTLYIGRDDCSIKADYVSGGGCQIGRYNSREEAIAALGIIVDDMQRSEIVHVPDDASVRARLDRNDQRNHHVTGKKTKGHGGS